MENAGAARPTEASSTGWGSEPFVTEFASERLRSGSRRRAVRGRTELPCLPVPPARNTGFARPISWTGNIRKGQRRALFVSWNGATDVAAWQLRYGPFPERPPGTNR